MQYRSTLPPGRASARVGLEAGRELSPARLLVIGSAGLGLVTFALYMVGAGRTLGYDAAVTFAHFIATPSIWDPFGRSSYYGYPAAALVGGNHLLLSFLEHLLFSATGSRSEALYRILPAAAAAGAVAVTAYALAKRFGALAGGCAGAFMAANPLFVEQSRDLRGYSLMTLFAVLSTLALLRLIRTPGRRPAAAYVLAAGAGVMSHIYAGLVLGGHLVLLARGGGPRLVMRFGPLVVLGGVLGALTYAGLATALRQEAAEQGHRFSADIGPLVVAFLLGAPYPVVLGLWLSAAGLGLVAAWRDPLVRWLAAAAGAALAFIWLVLQPALLYPRFFVFMVPGCAFLVAAAVRRWVVLGPVVLAGVVLAAWYQAPSWTEDPLALRPAAAALDRAQARGERGCVIAKDDEVVLAYTDRYRVIRHPDELAECDLVAVVTWNVDLPTRDAAATEFPYAVRYEAAYPAVVLSRRPIE